MCIQNDHFSKQNDDNTLHLEVPYVRTNPSTFNEKQSEPTQPPILTICNKIVTYVSGLLVSQPCSFARSVPFWEPQVLNVQMSRLGSFMVVDLFSVVCDLYHVVTL